MTQNLGTMKPIIVEDLSRFPVGISDGVQDADVGATGCIRVLGAAMAAGSGLDDPQQNQFKKGHGEHGDTLPREAPAGGNGLNLAITNIRCANRFTTGPVPLSNASQEELVAAGLTNEGARWIIGLRSLTVRSRTVSQFEAELRRASGLVEFGEEHRKNLAAAADSLAQGLKQGKFVF